jgi:predicted nucleic acid-binding protein
MIAVIDASVAVKWLLPEPGSAAAAALLEGPRKLIAPDLLRIEAAAAITRRVRLGQLSAADAQRMCEHWLESLESGSVLLLPAVDHIGSAIALALEIKHPLQDCLYLAVARAYDAALVTSDPALRDRGSAVHSQIEFIDASSIQPQSL